MIVNIYLNNYSGLFICSNYLHKYQITKLISLYRVDLLLYLLSQSL